MGGCQSTRLQRGHGHISEVSQAPQTKNFEIGETGHRKTMSLHFVKCDFISVKVPMVKYQFLLCAVASRQDCREGKTSSPQSRRHHRQSWFCVQLPADKTAERAKPHLHRVASTADRGDLKIRARSAFTNSQNAETLGLNSCRCQTWASIHEDAKEKADLKIRERSALMGQNPPQASGCVSTEGTTTSSG